MPEADQTYEEQLAELVRSLDEAQEEAERDGPVSPEDLRRMLDEARARGLREREIDQRKRGARRDVG